MPHNQIDEPTAGDSGFASSVDEMPANARLAAQSAWRARQRDTPALSDAPTRVPGRITRWILFVILTATGVALIVMGVIDVA